MLNSTEQSEKLIDALYEFAIRVAKEGGIPEEVIALPEVSRILLSR